MDPSSSFTNAPSDILFNSLSRLPTKTIMSCKCVCKPLCKLLETQDFAKVHFQRSKPGLIVHQNDCQMKSESLQVYEFEDASDLEHQEFHHSCVAAFNPKAMIGRPDANLFIQGSIDGFLCLSNSNSPGDTLYVCNPITREYIKLPDPERRPKAIAVYGFGRSERSGQYKAVRIFQEWIQGNETGFVPKFGCQVYTLGTDSWTCIAPDGIHQRFIYHASGVLIEGKLHWIVEDLERTRMISCFDLETETFDTLSLPGSCARVLLALGVLDSLLHVCDNSSDNEIAIWAMKEYGVENSWTKEYVISKAPDLAGPSSDTVYPLKKFPNGDIMLLWGDMFIFYYEDKTKSTRKFDRFQLQDPDRVDAIIHVSSFISPKSLVRENERSF